LLFYRQSVWKNRLIEIIDYQLFIVDCVLIKCERNIKFLKNKQMFNLLKYWFITDNVFYVTKVTTLS
jgi:hypothetical protein